MVRYLPRSYLRCHTTWQTYVRPMLTSFSSYDMVIEVSFGAFWHKNTECTALESVVIFTGSNDTRRQQQKGKVYAYRSPHEPSQWIKSQFL